MFSKKFSKYIKLNEEEKEDEKIEWCRRNIFYKKGLTQKEMQLQEREWGNKMINSEKNTCQWTTKLSEELVKDVFIRKGEKIWRPKKKNGYKPDWETEKYIIEVKSRNWNTPGTAGEKVFGVPYKYSDVPRLYGKQLLIRNLYKSNLKT